MLLKMAQEQKPICSFVPGVSKKFPEWKKESKELVLKTLGDFPKRVPLDAELVVEWEHDGLLKQKWLINPCEHLSLALQINRPLNMDTGKRHPAILCWHGHGKGGKEWVMGSDATAEFDSNKNKYGHEMAKHGFVTYAVDWMGFGDLNDTAKPNWVNIGGGRDWCNLYYLNATMLGMTSLSINLSFGFAATDFLSTLPYVAPDNFGVMGLSGGGTMTLWTAFCDPRMKAAEIICYSELWKNIGFRDFNYCGMQVAPGLYKLVELPDLQGLLAPMPLLIDIGVKDSCFNVEGAMQCFKKVSEIYRHAGAESELVLDLHRGEHGWAANKSFEFFKTKLQVPEGGIPISRG